MRRMIERVCSGREREGKLDLEATESAIREMGQRLGASLLQELINAGQSGRSQGSIECGKGHRAQIRGVRAKELHTVLGAVQVQREYYYCAQCREGIIPKDRELDIEGTCFSPGVRRMMGVVGGKEAFEEGRKDLELLAGVKVSTKAVERTSEEVGKQIALVTAQHAEMVVTGQVVPIESRKESVARLYVALDGTGVPMVGRETIGRKGKDESGVAHTREAKLGCVFTQTTTDKDGHPVRDEDSTTYTGAIENAQQFGKRIYAEAVRRGVRQAKEVVVLGDGAPWIWNTAEMYFYGATQIVDLYHALQHVSELAQIVYGASSTKSTQWARVRHQQLRQGQIEALIGSIHHLRPSSNQAKAAVWSTAEYFEKNRERMRYGEFRARGLFVGSGVVEAGCKTVVGLRLKQSGMHWTVAGANAIISLRSCQLSGRWNQYWETRAVG